MDEEDIKQSFVVKDKRRFDSEGNSRDNEVEQGAVTRSAHSGQAAGTKSADTGARTAQQAASSREARAPEINFSSFVMSLATQALMQLGDMPAPEGMDIPVDRVAAKQTIDILAMLQEKSVGNLDDNEKRLIEEVLHNLRMSYVNG